MAVDRDRFLSLEAGMERSTSLGLYPDDDKVLETALAGQADAIVTGDGDLLCLDPFEDIRILTAVRFIESITADS